MATPKPYSFRYPFDILTSMAAWREKLGKTSQGIYDPAYDEVIRYLTDRDRAIEDYLSLDVAQGILDFAGNGSAFDFGTLEADITGVSITVTVPAGRALKISWHVQGVNNDFVNPGGNNTVRIRAYEDATIVGFTKQADIADSADTTGRDEFDMSSFEIVAPTAGTHTYKLTAQITNGPSQNMTISGGGALLIVEDVGPIGRF